MSFSAEVGALKLSLHIELLLSIFGKPQTKKAKKKPCVFSSNLKEKPYPFSAMGESLDPSEAMTPEEVVGALLEYFVAPLLPIRDYDAQKPTDQQHETVANQVYFS